MIRLETGAPGQKKVEGLKAKDFQMKFKAESVTETGEFEGYASVYGNVDFYREVVEPGAFTECLQELKASGHKIPVLWNHRSDEVLGVYDELSEDARGLRVKGRLLVKEVAKARETAALISAGAVTGISIGYWIRDSFKNEETGNLHLTKLYLREASIVTFPANDEARVETIKMKLAHGTLPTAREFEKLLRDAGFSKSQAARIAAKGYCDFERGDPVQDHSAAFAALRDLRASIS